MKSNKNFFIVGTDTDVGKTYVSSLLFKGLKDRGYGYYKPVQSGCIEKDGKLCAPDPEFLCSFSSLPYDEEMCTYKLRAALSPHLASEMEGVIISKDLIHENYAKKLLEYGNLIVEGAGGVFVPLVRDQFFIYDLIELLDIPVVLVASPRVGGINHTMLTIKFLQSRGIDILGIVFNRYGGEAFERDNMRVVAQMSGIRNILVIEENQNSLEEKTLDRFLKGEMVYE